MVTTLAPPALTCEGLEVTLGRRSVLRGVDLEVAAGEWLGLIGPNGAGKSTLLRAVAGLVAYQGRVSVADGRRPAPTDVALVPQNPLIPEGMTVTEYVLLGRTPHLGWLARESRRDRELVAEVLVRVGLVPFADRAVNRLSGGETQRVVVARALAQETPLLLLDEPTSALDPGHQVAALELVDDLRHRDGLSVISAMHDLTNVARYADRLALIDRGRVVALGAPEEVLDPDRLSEVFGSPLTVQVVDGELVVLSAPRSPQRHEARRP